MKTKLMMLFILLSFFLSGIAQPQKVQLAPAENQTYNDAIAESMQSLDVSRIPYGVLYDRVMGWSLLRVWNNNDTINLPRVKQSWIDLQNSSMTGVIDTYTNFTQGLADAEWQDYIPLVSIFYQFSVIDTLAFYDGRMRVENNRLIDAGMASPYQTRQIGIASLGMETVVANKPYTLSAASLFRLTNQPVSSLLYYAVQNLTTGQSVTVYKNSASTFTSNTPGINVLRIQTVTTSGTYTTYQELKVLPSGGGSQQAPGANDVAPSHHLLTSTIPFQGPGESTPTISYADYHIYYHYTSPANTSQSERVLRKPIIILDGFDPEDIRSYKMLYEERLVYNENIKLGDELRKKGYDVIILNFPKTRQKAGQEGNKTDLSEDIPPINSLTRDGGTDFIQRNAFLLVKLIQETNAKLVQNGSTEKLVIVGPSMGGLISRYALAYMEKHNMNHNTRLWVSFDSPHLGANIPLALQANLDFYGNKAGMESVKQKYNNSLHTSAARQMLIEQLDGLNNSAPYRVDLINDLNNNGLPGSGGFPTIPKKICLVNGSSKGFKNNTEGKKFLGMSGAFSGWRAALLGNTTILSFSDYFLPKYNSALTYSVNYINRPFHYFTDPIYKANTIVNKNPRGSMDVVPGGTYDVQKEVADGFHSGLREQYIYNIGYNPNPMIHNSTFIPVASSLALKNATNWYESLTEASIRQKGSPFDYFYVPEYNEEHTFISANSVAWLMEQLDGNYYSVVRQPTISGPSTICDQATYSIENFPPGASVQWSVDNDNLLIISGQGTNSLVVKKVNNGNSKISAQVIINNNAVSLDDLKVTVSYPIVNWQLTTAPARALCKDNPGNNLVIVVGIPETPIYDVEWQFTNRYNQTITDWTAVVNNDFSSDYLKAYNFHYTPSPYPNSYDLFISMKYLNDCGWSSWSEPVEMPVVNCGSGWGNLMSLSPNPAGESVMVSFADEASVTDSSIQSKSSPYTIQLWNSFGLLRSVQTELQSYLLNLQGLPPGFYYVHVIKEGQTFRKQLVVK